MKNSIIYYLHKEVKLENSDDKIKIALGIGNLTIPYTKGTWKAFSLLVENGATEDKLLDIITNEGEFNQLSIFLYQLQQFIQLGIIVISAGTNTGNFAKLVPCSLLFKFNYTSPDPNQLYVFSRFAFIRRKEQNFIIESPLAYAHIELYDTAALEIIGFLSTPNSINNISSKKKDLAIDKIKGLFLLFINIQAITEQDNSASKEDKDDVLFQWEFHDLLFHTRSRMGRHNQLSGAAYPFIGKTEPTPALKKLPEGQQIPLYKPNIEILKKEDIPFTYVLEERKSVRKYGNKLITQKQLGEFLYRTARLRKLNPFNKETDLYETSDRPYPNGGASYELELYITINECEDIEQGIYYYDPKEHQLIQVSTDETYIGALIDDAWLSAAKTVKPQILITISSRFQRLNWKYRSMGYSASLKNTGVLYQTMYLVATAMNLAPCALGNGNAELFSRSVGTDYLKESSVGEFMLGT